MAARCGCEIVSNPLSVSWFQSFSEFQANMVSRGFNLNVLDSKCSSYGSHSQFLIFGLLLVYYSSHAQASSYVNCKSLNISSKYQHCGIHTDGIHDLDCFGKYILRNSKECVWKPGNHKSAKTYTLIIQQHPKRNKRYCRAYYNITQISKEITLDENYDMTAEVFENSESTNCTRAVFRGSPKSLLRCGPPASVSFSRKSGSLVLNVSWQQEDIRAVMNYSVRYKALGSPSWSKPPLRCQNGEKCIVNNVITSLVYIVQIQCETNKQCSQCPWSEEHTVPSELITQPVIVSLEETDIAGKKGRRLLSLAWKFPANELYEGYYVTIWKASGEACESLNTIQPQIRLILSHSAYHVNISAVNNASTSPAVSRVILEREDKPSMITGKLNMTVHSNKSFTVSWKDNLIKSYVCYSVEWMKTGGKAAHSSFHQNKENLRTLSLSAEPLQPYERYSLTLHTRPQKPPCNMKHVNNSESTYGRTQFYFIEGSPVSAPNISSDNVTLNSVVLQWSSIPEEDIRGFLLGYVIYYTEYHHRGTTTERNITVDPTLNSYKLRDLKGGTAYEAQISGFTLAGSGVRSKACLFKTDYQGFSNLSGVITVFAVVAAVLIFGSPMIKRAKVILWPSIPNPGNSNAMQKIDRPCELELLESINALKVEEWDTNSLQIVEKEDVIPVSTLPSMLPLLHASEDEEDSPEIICNWIQTDTEDAAGDISPDITAETFSDVQQTKPQSSAVIFSSDYTTMEMFQQGMPQGVPVNMAVTQAVENKPEDTDLTVVKSRLDYIRQFSTSPIMDGSLERTVFESH
ncbi:LOW QUALITY PROTEIN: interleukin-31 receptor subunit alpha [Centropristis striata]|uniref:LOW QUALITY PROTEIN: interleukin-31 receptor subunit alpha n=1 Tax=Centropristis striata TaxID=184440 RepID=UPI0027E1BD3F|nr:LOW QUALITY PROTEIN: interleukin-31 receptor subunit alpha [Centropristis striata]